MPHLKLWLRNALFSASGRLKSEAALRGTPCLVVNPKAHDDVDMFQEPVRYRIVPLTVVGSALVCLAAALPMQEPAFDSLAGGVDQVRGASAS